MHSSTEEDVACHRSKGLAGTYGAETTDCDSPFSLVNATFDWIDDNLRDKVDFVIWTGDSARHDSDEKHPRTTAQVLATNRFVADKFVDSFSSAANAQLSVPVVPTFGNNDFLPHNIFFPGPNKWLQAYSDIWRRFIPEEQRHSFAFGGWFYVEVIPDRLAVFSLNTMYFFDRNAGVDGCADPGEPGFQHMEWLRVQLQRMRERGMKAILTGHVPPARTDSKQNWDETCWQKYTLWLKQFRDVVAGAVYGHMNIDHFLLQDTKNIDLNLGASDLRVRDSIDEDISTASKEDYLQELIEEWSDLPGAVIQALGEGEEDEDMHAFKGKKGKKGKKKDKFKKIGGKYAERYQLSLISPSVVPNYFPTLRVVEYNITGLQDSAVWSDSFDASKETESSLSEPWDDQTELNEELKRDADTEKKKKGKKKKKPKDPNLTVPADPSKDSLPGPAYYPQPFTFTGYTQYYANLTHINNDVPNPDVDGAGWRDGNYEGKKPKHDTPKPRDFQYEVEYSTFGDKFFKLPDLTVRNYLKLAYRIGKSNKGKGKSLEVDADYDEHEDEDHDDDDDDNEEDELTIDATGLDDEDADMHDGSDVDDLESSDEVDAEKKGKKHKKKKHHKKNKAWLNFLDRAFVGTVPKKELKDY